MLPITMRPYYSPHPRRPFLLAIVIVFGLSGCGILRSGPPKPVGVTLVGEANLNDGNAAVVRLYALGGDANFTRVPPGPFWQDDRTALGDELIGAPREVVLFPDTSEDVAFTLDPTAQFVGVAANLRSPDADLWRAIVSAEALRGKALHVTVGRSSLTLEVRDR